MVTTNPQEKITRLGKGGDPKLKALLKEKIKEPMRFSGLSPAPFQIRLSGGPNLCAGRVEVFHQGEWGTVCDDDWDLQDVAVVCRELNCGEALSAPHGAWFGEGAGPIWLNEVHCEGPEWHLHTCHHLGFRRHVCTHEEDASAICSAQHFPIFTASPPHTTFKRGNIEPVTTTGPLMSPTAAEETRALRLVGGRSLCSGRLEVFHEGQWGTVCDDMWDLLDVAVVCRELDCGEALAAPGGAFFGEGNSVIWLDDVQCQGEESKLADCHKGPWGTNNCRHSEDAGAVCSGEMPLPMVEEHIAMLTRTLAPQRSWSMIPKRMTHLTQLKRNQEEPEASQEHTKNISKDGLSEDGQWQVRLVNGPGSCAGRVEVLHKGHWGTICDDGWDLVDAAVVCHELGCGVPLLSPGNARYGPGSGPIWLDDVNCTGRESTLQRCRSQPWGKHNCNHHEDASVICTDRWKRLLRPKPPGGSKTTVSISTTKSPGSPNNSGLQSVNNVAEMATVIQEIKPYNQRDIDGPFLTTKNAKLGLQTEIKPKSPLDIVEATADPKTLQNRQKTEATNIPKTRSPTSQWGRESTYSSDKSQPASITWYTESQREIKSTPHGVINKAIPSPENPQRIQEMGSTSSSTIRPPLQKWWPISPSKVFQPLPTGDMKSDKESESTSPSGIELTSGAQPLNSAVEMVPPFYGDNISEMLPAMKNKEGQYITTATWAQETEKDMKAPDPATNDLFWDRAEKVELPIITTQNLQPEHRVETTTPKVRESEENSDHKNLEESNTSSHLMESTDTTVAPVLTKIPKVTSAKPVTYSAKYCELPPDCLGIGKQDQRKEDQGSCCSPTALGNLVDAMKGLHGELGSLSLAIKIQGSQLEAVAHSLAELAASVSHLVGVLPSLVQSVSPSVP